MADVPFTLHLLTSASGEYDGENGVLLGRHSLHP